MENTGQKGFSFLPLIMLSLAVYVGFKTLFPTNSTAKIYVIKPAAEVASIPDTFPATATNDTLQNPSHWLAFNSTFQPKVIHTLPKFSPAAINQDILSFSPAPAPQEAVIQHLLAQGQTASQIAKQTGLKVKEIRKIKRKKKAEEKVEKKQAKTLLPLKIKNLFSFWK